MPDIPASARRHLEEQEEIKRLLANRLAITPPGWKGPLLGPLRTIDDVAEYLKKACRLAMVVEYVVQPTDSSSIASMIYDAIHNVRAALRAIGVPLVDFPMPARTVDPLQAQEDADRFLMALAGKTTTSQVDQPTKGYPGRPAIAPSEAARRRELVAQWEASRLSEREFCNRHFGCRTEKETEKAVKELRAWKQWVKRNPAGCADKIDMRRDI